MSTPPPGPGPGPGAPPPYAPPPVYAPAIPPPAPPKRRRFHPLLFVAGGFVLLFCVCSTVSLLGNSVGKTLYATATAQAATAWAVAPTQTAARSVEVAAQAATAGVAAGTATAVASQATSIALATRDAAGAARATADTEATANAPTVTPPPSFGSTIPNLNDWTISLAKMESRKLLTWSTFGNQLAPSGKFWLVWVDAKNLPNTSRGLQGTLDWELDDDHGARYAEISEANIVSISEFVRLQGRDPLTANVTPRAVTHPLLVFDVAADALPAQLIVKSAALLSSDAVTFDLTRK